MFTGLVEETGVLVAVDQSSNGARLTVRAPVAADTGIRRIEVAGGGDELQPAPPRHAYDASERDVVIGDDASVHTAA